MTELKRLYLVDPLLAYQRAFLDMARDFLNADERYGQYDLAFNYFERFLEKLDGQRHGRDMPAGHVPMHSYWLAQDGDTLLGESRLRTRLTPALEIEGGHIGYAIRPSARRKGYGTLILDLTLEKARTNGLQSVMVTCNKDNIASAKIIEKNGGLLSGRSISTHSGKAVSQYWIVL